MKYFYVLKSSVDAWCDPQKWVDTRTEYQKREFTEPTGLCHVSLGVFFGENFRRIHHSELGGLGDMVELIENPSCEKNPADAQPETGVAEPGKKE